MTPATLERPETTTPAPERSLEQRLAALKLANEIRTRRAALKRDLKASRVDVVTLIAEPPAWLATAKIYDLLLATPKLGRVRTNRILIACRVSPSKTVGGLSERQRGEIVAHVLRAPAPSKTPGGELVPVALFRELANAADLSVIAVRLGWLIATRNAWRGDVTRVKIALGMVASNGGVPRGKMRMATALKFCDAFQVHPSEVGL